jgi:hypothetical protein
MRVHLRGAAEAVLARESVEVEDGSTLDAIVREISSYDSELHRQLLREDGSPRSAAKVLVDGVPATSLSSTVPAGATVTVSPTMSCDG